MSRIDFTLTREGRCFVSNGTSIEDDRAQAVRDGDEPEGIAHHLSLDGKKGLGSVIDILRVVHSFECDIDDVSQLPVETLVGMIFNEGVKYGRNDVLSPLLERTKRGGL